LDPLENSSFSRYLKEPLERINAREMPGFTGSQKIKDEIQKGD
jgi:hypothetical protein